MVQEYIEIPGGRPRTLEMRAVINAILYIVVSGSQWRMLPREYPAWQSVYTYFRHTFAVRYLVLGNDPFSLQELLGHEDMTTVKNYMHMNDETIQSQKRKYSPDDHLPTRMPGPKENRRRGFQAKERGRKSSD